MSGRPVVAMHAEIERRKQQWCALYDPTSGVRQLYVIHLDAELPPRPWPRPDNTEARIEWALEKYECQLDRLAWLDDDSVPFLDLYTGTDIFAAAFGCPVHYPDADMPFARPAMHSADEVAGLPTPTLDAAPIRQLFEIGHALRERAGEPVPLRIPDIQSPMDIAALIWEKEDFFRALVQTPAAVEALAARVRQFLVTFLDEWFRTFGPAFISHYPDYYMPRGLTVSEDEVGSVSNRMFERLFLPELAALSRRYGGLGMHCCAHARHQWASFRKIPGLRLLNFVQPAEVTVEAIAYFADHTAQMHFYMGEGPAWTWPAQHPAAARLAYDVQAQSRAEALEVMAQVRGRA